MHFFLLKQFHINDIKYIIISLSSKLYTSEDIVIAFRFHTGDIKTTEKEIKRCFIDVFKLTDSTFLKQASKQ